MLTAGAVVLSTPHAAVAADRPKSTAAAEVDDAVAELEKALETFKANPVTDAESAEAALAAATVQDHRVEILQMRTETDTVYANPDGTLTRTTAAGPIRMIQDGQWANVDADLQRDPDGGVSAKAHPAGLTLAGKGGTPAQSLQGAASAPLSQARDLITLGSGSERIAVQWKGGLPARS
ncbi:hypothetical protein E4K10_17845 [Streptomyces sp. T1317-0309]|nr:hypothetical protein E4K10_17845 [Streptomyces sp. T1317-0309]